MTGDTRQRAGLLHTVPALAATFDALLFSSPADRLHLVDADLLSTAVNDGVTPELEQRVGARLRLLADGGADAILVTCSSIAEAAEESSRTLSVPVLRVDAPMAAEAIRLATEAAGSDRIASMGVLATLHATLGPTRRLLERTAAASDHPADISAGVVAGAYDARFRGDQETHDRLISEAVRQLAATVQVVVLAQASMASAAHRAELGIPVLTSPTSGADAFRSLLAQQALR